MKYRAAVLLSLLAYLDLLADGPAAFAWDAPDSLRDVAGYRLQWGPQQTSDIPLHQTQFIVEDMPDGFLLPVSVVSLSAETNSDPASLYIFNLNVIVEESETLNGPATGVASVRIMGPRKATSFLRLRVEGQ